MRSQPDDDPPQTRPVCAPRERRAVNRALAPPRGRRLACGAVVLLTASTASAQRVEVRAPMACTRGPSTQSFTAVVTAPEVARPGAVFTVRIDSVSSGRVSNFGLNHLFDMRTDYAVEGGRVVAGSARVLPGTGTPNVRAGARVWLDGAGLHLLLPSHMENGDHFTPPSVEFRVVAGGAAGGVVRVRFVHYEVRANVFLLGDIRTSCDPAPGPAVLATTRVEAAPPEARERPGDAGVSGAAR